MSIIKRIGIRNIVQDKRASIMTIISIALSVAMTTMVVSLMFGVLEEFERSTLESSERYNVEIYSVYDSEKLIDTIGREYVDVYSPRIFQNSILENEENEMYRGIEGFNYKRMEAFTPIIYPDRYNKTLIMGRFPETDRELVLSEDFYNSFYKGYEIGDAITSYEVNHNQDGVIATPTEPYTLVGVATGYENFTFIDSFKFEPSNNTSIEDSYKTTGYVRIKFKDGTKNIESLVEKVNTPDLVRSTDDGSVPAYYNEEYNTILGMQNKLSTTKKVFLGIAVLFSVILSAATFSLIFNAFNVSMERRIHSYGLLRSIGATKKQLKHIIRFEGIFLSVLGISLGLLIGFGIASGIAAFINHQIAIAKELYGTGMEMTLYAKLPLSGILIVFVISLLMMSIPMSRSIRKLFKLTSIEAIRENKKQKEISKHLKDYRNPSWGLGNLYIKRGKKSYRGIQTALVICMVIFIALTSCITIVMQRSREMFDANHNLYVSSHSYETTYDDANAYRKLVSEALADDTVEAHVVDAVAVFDLSLFNGEGQKPTVVDKLKSEDIDLYIYPRLLVLPETTFNTILKDMSIKTTSQHPALLMNHHQGYAYNSNSDEVYDGSILNIAVGDSIVPGYETYLKQDMISHVGEAQFTVEALLDEIPVYSSYFDNRGGNISPQLIISEASMDYFLKNMPEDFFTANNIQKRENFGFSRMMTFIESADPFQTEKTLKTLELGYSYVSNLATEQATMRQIQSSINTILYFMMAFITSVCILNMVSVSITNLNIRRSETASLRSVGLSQKGVSHMLLSESILIMRAPLVIGSLAGLGISYAFYALVKHLDQYYDYAFKFDIKALLISWLLMIIVIATNSFITSQQSKRNSIVEDMRSI